MNTMTIAKIRVPLAALVLLVGVIAGCNEALFSSNTDDNLPNIPDGEGTPWVEFIGDETMTADRGSSVTLTLEPGEAVGESITVEFETSGTAVAGEDFTIGSGGSPVTIPYDSETNNLDQADIVIDVLANSAATSMRTLTITLTGASTEGGRQIDVGRGGTEIDRSRTIEINP